MKKILSFILVLAMSLGMVLSVNAAEYNNNLSGQSYNIIDPEGNIVAQYRLGVTNPKVPAGYGTEWTVNVKNGKNTMSISVTPYTKLQLQVTNAVGVNQYSYTTSSEVNGVTTNYNSDGSGRGIYRVWNKSSHDMTILTASFNVQ